MTNEEFGSTHLLRREIINVLHAMHGLEAFKPVIENGDTLLETLPAVSLRQLELYLIHEGRVGIVIPRMAAIADV